MTTVMTRSRYDSKRDRRRSHGLLQRLTLAEQAVRQCVVQVITEAEMTARLLELGYHNIVWDGDEVSLEYNNVTYTVGG